MHCFPMFSHPKYRHKTRPSTASGGARGTEMSICWQLLCHWSEKFLGTGDGWGLDKRYQGIPIDDIYTLYIYIYKCIYVCIYICRYRYKVV